MRILISCLVLLWVSSFEAFASSRSGAAIQAQTPKLKVALAEQNLELGAPVFLRIVKSSNGRKKDGYLEAFVKDNAGTFRLFRRWDICTYSGEIGPKTKQGDRQAPEGFYFVTPGRMNPSSSYLLSFNLGYPNAYDRAHGYTGDFLMVHGQCVSIGCYAMGNDGIEEIYTLLTAAFDNGQPFVRVQAFPFPMTDKNLRRHETHTYAAFWENLKEGWDWFETHKTPPDVTVSDRRYMFGK